MISSQSGIDFSLAKHEYDKLKKVYSIWITTGAPKKYQNTISKEYLKKTNLVGDLKEANDDLMTIIMIRLGQTVSENEVLKLLNALFMNGQDLSTRISILRDDFQLKNKDNIDKEIYDMCNLSDGIEERGINKGLVQGLAQGKEEMAKEIALKMLEQNYDIEQISILTGLSVGDVKILTL